MDWNYIEIPPEVRQWINRQPGYDGINVRENTFTNQEKWLLGRTDAQIWEYAKSDPFWTCPLFSRACRTDCNLSCGEKRGSRECWEVFTKWASTPIQKRNGGIDHGSEEK